MNRLACRKYALALPLLLLPAACGGGDASAAGGMPPLPPTPLGLDVPGFEMIIPEDNPLTAEKAWLGKHLFFDTRLSSNGEMSCQTCHLHEHGWSNGQRFSTKVNGEQNTRNSPTLYNVGYLLNLYWDGRAPNLEANILAAWKGHMGGDPEAMAEKLAAIPEYTEMFAKAFDDAAPSGDRIVKALASFVRTLRSGNSAWDRHEKGGETGAVSQDAIQGHAVFVGKGGCIACHTPPLYTDRLFHNVGVGIDAEDPDLGRGKHVEDPKMDGAFKTPTLRSVSETAPYFHDGSRATLEEAVRFMAGGGNENPKRDPLLVDRKLNDQEIAQLVAFLKSLASTEEFEPPTLPAEK